MWHDNFQVYQVSFEFQINTNIFLTNVFAYDIQKEQLYIITFYLS